MLSLFILPVCHIAMSFCPLCHYLLAIFFILEWQDLVRLVIQILVVYLVLATRWLYHLVSEVLEMSSTLFMDCWGKAYKSGSVYASQFYRIGLLHWNKFYNKYIKSFASSSKLFSSSALSNLWAWLSGCIYFQTSYFWGWKKNHEQCSSLIHKLPQINYTLRCGILFLYSFEFFVAKVIYPDIATYLQIVTLKNYACGAIIATDNYDIQCYRNVFEESL